MNSREDASYNCLKFPFCAGEVTSLASSRQIKLSSCTDAGLVTQKITWPHGCSGTWLRSPTYPLIISLCL